MRTDYEQAGIPYDRPGVRIDRFAEGVAVLKGCFAEGPFSFEGKHYTITDYDALPLPIQRPRPPFLIGGGGRRVLTIAAQEADIIGINGTITAGAVGPEALDSMTAKAVDDKVAIVAEAAAERISEIELHVRGFFVNVTDDRQGAVDGAAGFIGVPASMITESPFALIGNPDEIVADLRARRDRWGFSYISVGAEDVDVFAPVVAELKGT